MTTSTPPKNLAESDNGAALQSQVLAWLAEDKTRGYTAAARLFGLPKETVKAWARSVREGKPPAKPNARTAARAHARASGEPPATAPPPGPPEDVVWDPATCTQREFLTELLRSALRGEALAASQGHGGVARQWHESATHRRAELDALTRAEAEAHTWAAKASHVSPEDLVRRVLALAPVLARVDPIGARACADAFLAVLPRES